jgi:hypothetical protein
MKSFIRAVFILSLAGTLFAGSVTARQYISPAGEPGLFSCVGLSIFGLSPCPYGLALFISILVVSSLMLWTNLSFNRLLGWLRLVTTAGVLFSGWVAWRELCAPALAMGAAYWETFSLARVPACVWGFFIFLVVAVLAWVAKPRVSQPVTP